MIRSLLATGPVAVNVGVETFAASLAEQDVPVVHVEWRPPPELSPRVAALLDALG